MVPYSKESEEEVEFLPKPEYFFLLFVCHVLSLFYHICSQHTASCDFFLLRVCNVTGFSRAACVELAEVDGVATLLLQSFLFPKSSTAFLNFNNFRFVRFNPVCCPSVKKSVK